MVKIRRSKYYTRIYGHNSSAVTLFIIVTSLLCAPLKKLWLELSIKIMHINKSNTKMNITQVISCLFILQDRWA